MDEAQSLHARLCYSGFYCLGDSIPHYLISQQGCSHYFKQPEVDKHSLYSIQQSLLNITLKHTIILYFRTLTKPKKTPEPRTPSLHFFPFSRAPRIPSSSDDNEARSNHLLDFSRNIYAEPIFCTYNQTHPEPSSHLPHPRRPV